MNLTSLCFMSCLEWCSYGALNGTGTATVNQSMQFVVNSKEHSLSGDLSQIIHSDTLEDLDAMSLLDNLPGIGVRLHSTNIDRKRLNLDFDLSFRYLLN